MSIVKQLRVDKGLDVHKDRPREDFTALVLQNFDFDGNYIFTRKGNIKFNSSEISGTGRILGVHVWQHPQYGRIPICARNTSGTDVNIYKADMASKAWTSKKSYLTDDRDVYFKEYRDFLFAGNGKQPLLVSGNGDDWVYAGGSASSTPVMKVLEVYENRLFGGNESTLSFSKTNSESNFELTNSIGIPKVRQDEITVLQRMLGALIILKEDSKWILRGWDVDSFRLSDISLKTGCIAPRSAQMVERHLVYLNRDRELESLNGETFEVISWKIKPILEDMNPNLSKRSCSIYYKRKFWLSYVSAGSQTHDTIVVFELQPKSIKWAKYKGINVSCFFNDGINLWGGDASSGYVRLLDTGNDDDGVAIEQRYRRTWFDAKDPHSVKQFQELAFQFGNTGHNATVKYMCDGRNTGGSEVLACTLPDGSYLGPTGNFTLGPTGTNNVLGPRRRVYKRLRLDPRYSTGHKFTFEIYNNTQGQHLEMFDNSLSWQHLHRRGLS